MAIELEELKLKAKELGISFSPNIGAEALRKKIEAVEIKPIEADPVSDKQKQQARLRTDVRKEALRLIRCRISNNDPAKRDLQGDYYTVANQLIGKVTKYVPFRGKAAESYHIPYCIYRMLINKKYISIDAAKGNNLNQTSRARELPEFNIEILEPLTEEELQELAKEQAAGNRID